MLLPVVLAAVSGMMTDYLTKSVRGRKDFLEHTAVRAPPVDGSGSMKELTLTSRMQREQESETWLGYTHLDPSVYNLPPPGKAPLSESSKTSQNSIASWATSNSE